MTGKQPRRPGPPSIPLVISVGVTGHRSDVLPAGSVELLGDRVRAVLKLIEEAGGDLLKHNRDLFAEQPLVKRLVSPIADGADQIAAQVALDLGWELHAVLPFARGRYRESLADGDARETFDRLLERATCTLELPGEEQSEVEAYVMTGRATVAHSDVIIALWDGRPPRGRGGTGEVVQLALTRGAAIIHIPIEPDLPDRLLWSAFDPMVLTRADELSAQRPVDHDSVRDLLTGLLMLPPDQNEHRFYRRFATERLRRIRTRIEYPLLLAAAGVRRVGFRDIREKHAEEMIREEWQRYREGCVTAHQITTPIDLLEEAYSWADRLATHFAQSYRSGHIFNFLLGGIAVCMGLAAFLVQRFKFIEASLEMLITLAIILNAYVATRNEWHRRWLDYRQLAERLRPMRSLKLLGIAAPDPPGTATNPVPRRWIDWYAGGIWRGMGCPSGVINPERADRLATSIAEHEVEPQVGYHQRNAAVIARLDRRLGKIGFFLFAVTLVVSAITLIGLGIGADFVNRYGNWITLVSAGFPALGTAVFGIRFQADFGGDALRSLATSETLGHIQHELRKDVTLSRAADLTEQAARIMLSDLDEWRLVNQQRDLSVG